MTAREGRTLDKLKTCNSLKRSKNLPFFLMLFILNNNLTQNTLFNCIRILSSTVIN